VPILYASGEGLNLLARARTLIHDAGSDGADPLFPEANLWDGRPALPCRFLGDTIINVDLAGFENGDFESWEDTDQATGWTFDPQLGDGLLEQSAGMAHSGSFGARIVGGSNGAVLSRRFRVRAGEKRHLQVWLRGNIRIRLHNTATGRGLDPSGDWVSPSGPVLEQDADVYVERNINYQVESLHRCGGRGMVTLQLEVLVVPGLEGAVDDLNDWPAVDMLSFHGLLCQGNAVPTWRLSDDGTTWTDPLAAGDLSAGFQPDEIPNLYLRRGATTYKRWHQVAITETQFVPPEIGELVLSQVSELTDMAEWGTELRVIEANIRNEVGDGDMQAFGHSLWPRRAIVFRWAHAERSGGAALAGMREARDEFWGRARGGRHNILIVPRTDERQVLLVRAEDDFSVRRLFKVFADQEQLLTELPFASSVM
jgi:hypothetical protein